MTERSKEDLYSKCRYMLTEKFALEMLRLGYDEDRGLDGIAQDSTHLADLILEKLGIEKPEAIFPNPVI